MMAGKPSPRPNYHLTEINQPALNEKRALTAGGQGSYHSPGRGKHWVSYAKHTTRNDELTEPVRGSSRPHNSDDLAQQAHATKPRPGGRDRGPAVGG